MTKCDWNRRTRAALLTGSALLLPQVAMAQEAPGADPALTSADDQSESEIVVTGFRASLDSALRAKRNETAIVDVIKAEDIGKFPDTNLAESLQRVPGVVIDRDAGEGRSITVRGLGADFTRVRINGIEALATTGGTDSSGGNNRGRGFDFNVFASELFNSITVRKSSAANVEAGHEGLTLVCLTDRTSNGPHLVFPTPSAPGGTPMAEDWVMANFRRDPWAGNSMIETAESVAAEHDISRPEIDALTLLRYEQYVEGALADDRAFQRTFMVPVELFGREAGRVEADVGVHDTTAEGLARLQPVLDGGRITFGSQTHPADGAAGMIVTNEVRARELASDGIVHILAVGFARVGKGLMPTAPVPAANAALGAAHIRLADVDAVTTHNPFAINDVYFARETGFPRERMNEFGSSLVYGHPHAPTGARLIAELIEHLRRRGGGIGLFTGCAAGDTGAAVVVRLADR